MANSSNLSMVLVMNNMVHGQKGGSHHGRKNVLAKNLQKRGNSSTNTPGTQYHNKGNQRVQNEFYFWMRDLLLLSPTPDLSSTRPQTNIDKFAQVLVHILNRQNQKSI